MGNRVWKVYLSGEIHTKWREEIRLGVERLALPLDLLTPVTIHEDSDNCGAIILGSEQDKFWHDRKGAAMNAIRTRALIGEADIVVVRFGDQYRQWNAAYDAGMSVAWGKSLITLHDGALDHALKEVDASASAVCRQIGQVIDTLRYIVEGHLPEELRNLAAE
jgi:YtoQ family protein